MTTQRANPLNATLASTLTVTHGDYTDQLCEIVEIAELVRATGVQMFDYTVRPLGSETAEQFILKMVPRATSRGNPAVSDKNSYRVLLLTELYSCGVTDPASDEILNGVNDAQGTFTVTPADGSPVKYYQRLGGLKDAEKITVISVNVDKQVADMYAYRRTLEAPDKYEYLYVYIHKDNERPIWFAILVGTEIAPEALITV